MLENLSIIFDYNNSLVGRDNLIAYFKPTDRNLYIDLYHAGVLRTSFQEIRNFLDVENSK